MTGQPFDPAAVRAALATALAKVGVPAAVAELADGVSLADDLGLDSMQLMEVARLLEDALGRDLALGDWVRGIGATLLPDRTVGALIRHVGARRGG